MLLSISTCAATPWGGEIPLNATGTGPFFGQMGVAPPPALGVQTSILPGAHGGNLDNKRLGPGATLYLPVNVKGAHFSAGDGQGLTLVHFSAQPEPFLTQKHTSNTP